MRMLASIFSTMDGGYIKNPLNPNLRREHQVQFNEQCRLLEEFQGFNRQAWQPDKDRYGKNVPLAHYIKKSFTFMTGRDYPQSDERIGLSICCLLQALSLFSGKPSTVLFAAEVLQWKKGESPDISHILFDDLLLSADMQGAADSDSSEQRRALLMTCFMRVYAGHSYSVFCSCGVVGLQALLEKYDWFRINVLAKRYPDKDPDAWTIDTVAQMKKGTFSRALRGRRVVIRAIS